MAVVVSEAFALLAVACARVGRAELHLRFATGSARAGLAGHAGARHDTPAPVSLRRHGRFELHWWRLRFMPRITAGRAPTSMSQRRT